MAGSSAVVIVRDGIPPLIQVQTIAPFVNPSVDLQLSGEASRLDTDCSITWSTAFQVGFNYFNLQHDVNTFLFSFKMKYSTKWSFS